MEELVNIIKSADKKSRLPVKFIAIDGHGGSGKSTLGKLLSSKLRASLVSTDDFAHWDNPHDWWPQLIKGVFEPIKDGAKVLNYKRAPWWPDHNPEPVVNMPVTKTMILEGVSSSRREFRDYLSFAIWVEAPKKVCLARGIERDKNQETLEEVTKVWKNFYADEEEYISRDNPKEYADVIVDGTKEYE